MALIELKCPNCGDVLKVNDELSEFYCESCRTRIINVKDEKVYTVNINDNKNIRIENITRDEAEIEKTVANKKITIGALVVLGLYLIGTLILLAIHG